MRGQPAKTLTATQLQSVLQRAEQTRYPSRNRAIVMLSFYAGLRACEISRIEWRMVLDADDCVGATIDLAAKSAKKGSGRRIPMKAELQQALSDLIKLRPTASPFIFRSERGCRLSAKAIVDWFSDIYRGLGLTGCSSHSGRRTFVTRAAKLIPQAGGSIRDVQLLVGHRSLKTTQAYIDGDSEAQRAVVNLL